jgi:hypothetical protein
MSGYHKQLACSNHIKPVYTEMLTMYDHKNMLYPSNCCFCESVITRLSRAVFWWVFSLLKLGKRKTIVAEDIPGLTKEHQSVVLAKRLRECFHRERAAQDKVTIAASAV